METEIADALPEEWLKPSIRSYAKTACMIEFPNRSGVIYSILIDFARQSDEAWPSKETLCEILGVAKTTNLARDINKLIESGWISRIGAAHRGNAQVYKINVAKALAAAEEQQRRMYPRTYKSEKIVDLQAVRERVSESTPLERIESKSTGKGVETDTERVSISSEKECPDRHPIVDSDSEKDSGDDVGDGVLTAENFEPSEPTTPDSIDNFEEIDPRLIKLMTRFGRDELDAEIQIRGRLEYTSPAALEAGLAEATKRGMHQVSPAAVARETIDQFLDQRFREARDIHHAGQNSADLAERRQTERRQWVASFEQGRWKGQWPDIVASHLDIIFDPTSKITPDAYINRLQTRGPDLGYEGLAACLDAVAEVPADKRFEAFEDEIRKLGGRLAAERLSKR